MLINNNYLSYYKMREMEPMPKDNYKNKNILIEDEEPQDTKINEISPNDQIDTKRTNDIALNIKDESLTSSNSNYFLNSFYQNYLPNIVLLSALLILIIVEIIYKDALFKYSLTY